MEDKPRYSRISDILELLTLMQSKVLGITLSDIQKQFNVSRRTAERLRDSIINILPQINEIETNDKEKHWGFISGFMSEIITFSPDEIASLEGLKETLTHDEHKKLLEKTLTKLKALSRKQLTKIEDEIEVILKSEGVAVTQKPDYKINVEILNNLRQAIKETRKIICNYNNKEKNLAPYGIIYGSGIYLIAVEGEYKNPYVYKLHKIADIELTNEKFDKGSFDIKEFANQSFGIYQNEIIKVELLFSKDVAEDVLNFSFHPTQKIKQNDDGTITVKFKASGELEILWHIFKWGNSVKIISPTKLKKQYIELLENCIKAQV